MRMTITFDCTSIEKDCGISQQNMIDRLEASGFDPIVEGDEVSIVNDGDIEAHQRVARDLASELSEW